MKNSIFFIKIFVLSIILQCNLFSSENYASDNRREKRSQKAEISPVNVSISYINSETNSKKRVLDARIIFEIEPNWHIYSQNPGDIGLPTKIEWNLPKNATVSMEYWPEPVTYKNENFVTSGYEKSFAVNVKIDFSKLENESRNQILQENQVSTHNNGDLDISKHNEKTKESADDNFISCKISWIACKEEMCAPGQKEFVLSFPNNFLDNSSEFQKKEYAFGKFMFLAFLGGLLLNFMPCVFPVLGIKILGFVKLAGAKSSVVKKHGLVFAFGVLFSFWILSGILLILRSFGNQLGWGFQLQNPIFVIILNGLLVLLALNLFGVFDVRLSVNTNFIDNFSKKSAYLESFMSGILVVILASPCTAPFMGTALGFAMTQPAIVSFGIFTFLAIGLSFPYVLLSFFPKMLKILPKPGDWMETFKEIMTFPVLMTVVWLLWVLGNQTHMQVVLASLFGFVMITMGAWIHKKSQFSRKICLFVTKICLFVLGFCIPLIFTLNANFENFLSKNDLSVENEICKDKINLQEDSEYDFSQKLSDKIEKTNSILWEPFSEKKVREYLSKGMSVFVDFTADWCLTCQFNEKMIFERPEVKNAFISSNLKLMKGDWTKKDSEIARALEKFGRMSVPLYILFKPTKNDNITNSSSDKKRSNDKNSEPNSELEYDIPINHLNHKILPNILSVKTILDAL